MVDPSAPSVDSTNAVISAIRQANSGSFNALPTAMIAAALRTWTSVKLSTRGRFPGNPICPICPTVQDPGPTCGSGFCPIAHR